MIRVTVDSCPGGNQSRAEQIGRMTVWREHADKQPISRYGYRRTTRGSTSTGGGIEHRRQEDVWALLRAVLNHSEPHPGYCQSCHRENPEDEA